MEVLGWFYRATNWTPMVSGRAIKLGTRVPRFQGKLAVRGSGGSLEFRFFCFLVGHSGREQVPCLMNPVVRGFWGYSCPGMAEFLQIETNGRKTW